MNMPPAMSALSLIRNRCLLRGSDPAGDCVDGPETEVTGEFTWTSLRFMPRERIAVDEGTEGEEGRAPITFNN